MAITTTDRILMSPAAAVEAAEAVARVAAEAAGEAVIRQAVPAETTILKQAKTAATTAVIDHPSGNSRTEKHVAQALLPVPFFSMVGLNIGRLPFPLRRRGGRWRYMVLLAATLILDWPEAVK